MNSYKVRFRFYDLMPEIIYIQAKNYRDAFEKAHKFITPYDNVQFIEPERVSKAYMEKVGATYAPAGYRVRRNRNGAEYPAW